MWDSGFISLFCSLLTVCTGYTRLISRNKLVVLALPQVFPWGGVCCVHFGSFPVQAPLTLRSKYRRTSRGRVCGGDLGVSLQLGKHLQHQHLALGKHCGCRQWDTEPTGAGCQDPSAPSIPAPLRLCLAIIGLYAGLL